MTRLQAMSGFFAVTLATCSVAQAQATRTWVSGVGDDANPCTRQAPCKTFAGALAKTAAAGEIDALDPGDFGSVTIAKAITINGGGGQIASVQAAGTSGVIIQAGGADAVTLRNLDIVGGGLTGDGIQIASLGKLNLDNVHISGLQGNGINLGVSAPVRLYIDNSSSNNNGADGLVATSSSGTAIVAISHSHFEGNIGGGVSAVKGSKISITDSTASGNANGFIADGTGGSASITLTRCDATGNTTAGFAATQNGVLRAGYSSSELNGVALSSGTNGNTVTYGNNTLVGAGVFTLTSALH